VPLPLSDGRREHPQDGPTSGVAPSAPGAEPEPVPAVPPATPAGEPFGDGSVARPGPAPEPAAEPAPAAGARPSVRIGQVDVVVVNAAAPAREGGRRSESGRTALSRNYLRRF